MSNPSADEFISLGKDAGLDLQKSDGLSKISVILRWDTDSYEGDFDFDLDAEAFLLNKNNRVRNNQDLVFYKNLAHVSGAVVHQGDNSVLKGDADGEIIDVDLDLVPKNIEKIVFTVTIDDAEFREQNFGMVNNTYISIIDTATGKVTKTPNATYLGIAIADYASADTLARVVINVGGSDYTEEESSSSSSSSQQ